MSNPIEIMNNIPHEINMIAMKVHSTGYLSFLVNYTSIHSFHKIYHTSNMLLQTQFIIVQFSCSVMSDSLQPHGLQHARLPCPSPTPRAYSNSCPSCPNISSSVIPFSSRLQSFPASESSQMSQFFASGDQSTGTSASATVLPMNIQGWFPLG